MKKGSPTIWPPSIVTWCCCKMNTQNLCPQLLGTRWLGGQRAIVFNHSFLIPGGPAPADSSQSPLCTPSPIQVSTHSPFIQRGCFPSWDSLPVGRCPEDPDETWRDQVRSRWSTGRVPLKARPCSRQSRSESLAGQVYWLRTGRPQPLTANHPCILCSATYNVYLAFRVLSVTSVY